MRELNLAIVRANERIEHIEDTLSAIKRIYTTLKGILVILNEFQEKTEKPTKEEIETLVKLLNSVSTIIGNLRARRGSAVMRHVEVPWKHLICLGQPVTELILNKPEEISSDILPNICKIDEITLLSSTMKEIIAEEEETIKNVKEVIALLEHEKTALNPIREYIQNLKKSLIPYKAIIKLLPFDGKKNLQQ